jgi:hypothetical protein
MKYTQRTKSTSKDKPLRLVVEPRKEVDLRRLARLLIEQASRKRQEGRS